jgi:hypothetical protein
VPSNVSARLGALAYGVLVFLGTAAFGFVVAPALGTASGRFPIETEAAGVFSMLTLAAVPWLVGLSGAAALSYAWVARLSVPRRAAVYATTVVLSWLVGAAIAALLLG